MNVRFISTKHLIISILFYILNIGFLSAQKLISQDSKDRFEKLLVLDLSICEGLDKNITLEQRIDLTQQLLKDSPFVFEGRGV